MRKLFLIPALIASVTLFNPKAFGLDFVDAKTFWKKHQNKAKSDSEYLQSLQEQLLVPVDTFNQSIGKFIEDTLVKNPLFEFITQMVCFGAETAKESWAVEFFDQLGKYVTRLCLYLDKVDDGCVESVKNLMGQCENLETLVIFCGKKMSLEALEKILAFEDNVTITALEVEIHRDHPTITEEIIKKSEQGYTEVKKVKMYKLPLQANASNLYVYKDLQKKGERPQYLSCLFQESVDFDLDQLMIAHENAVKENKNLGKLCCDELAYPEISQELTAKAFIKHAKKILNNPIFVLSQKEIELFTSDETKIIKRDEAFINAFGSYLRHVKLYAENIDKSECMTEVLTKLPYIYKLNVSFKGEHITTHYVTNFASKCKSCCRSLESLPVHIETEKKNFKELERPLIQLFKSAYKPY